MGIVDSQSVPNANSAEERLNFVQYSYDGGKHKRHATVDTLGLPHALHVTTANVGDRDGAVEMITLNLDDLSCVKKILADGGYSGDNFANAVKEILGNHVEVEVVKRNELHKFVVLPKRWIVERSFGWIGNARRLWKNCERTLHNSLQMLILAFFSILISSF